MIQWSWNTEHPNTLTPRPSFRSLVDHRPSAVERHMSRLLRGIPALAALSLCSLAVSSDPLPPDTTYRPLPTLPFSEVKTADAAQKPQVMQRQSNLLNQRYDLSNGPI